MSQISDALLKKKVDRIFERYDKNKAGTLSLNELHVFLNDLLASTGYSRRVSYEQAYDVLRSIDQNKDGQINKYELLQCLKYLTQPSMGGLLSGMFTSKGSQKQTNQLDSQFLKQPNSMQGYFLPKPTVYNTQVNSHRIGTYESYSGIRIPAQNTQVPINQQAMNFRPPNNPSSRFIYGSSGSGNY